MTVTDITGFFGVFLLLIAFFLNLFGKIRRESLLYILLNIAGAGIAAVASCLLNYLPFIILESTWTIVSVVALIRYYGNNKKL
jgi:hypothetical protein